MPSGCNNIGYRAYLVAQSCHHWVQVWCVQCMGLTGLEGSWMIHQSSHQRPFAFHLFLSGRWTMQISVMLSGVLCVWYCVVVEWLDGATSIMDQIVHP